MDTSSTSQKKIRKSLRSRRVKVDIHAPFAAPKHDKPETIQRKPKKAKLIANRQATIVVSKNSHFDETRRDPDIESIPNEPKTGKGIHVESDRNVSSNVPNRNNGSGPKTTVEECVLPDSVSELSDIEGDQMDVLENRSEIELTDSQGEKEDARETQRIDNNHHRDSTDSNRRETQSIVDVQDNRELGDNVVDSDPESSQSNCLEDVLQEVNKDIGALYAKTNKVEADLKEIKQILLSRRDQHCIRTVSSRFKQKMSVSLLPKTPLKKRSAVREMDEKAEDEESEDYKDQLVNIYLTFWFRFAIFID